MTIMRWLAHRSHRIKQIISYGIILLFILMFVCPLLSGLVFALNRANAEGASTVRVNLTNLALHDRIHIGVYGNYSIDSRMGFQRGSEITVGIDAGSLTLYYEGMVLKAGPSVTLVRHQSVGQEENGLRLQRGFNLYTGDLALDIYGGQLRAILTIPVEEYLMGVVPYEMADDFPLEALKAQAIAARTYTLAHLKPLEDFDLVDNTNDQVYRGLEPSKKNAVKAVMETKGVCCVYQGTLAQCYYTASNGGYTESAFNAWGRESIPYLFVQKDPYDLENPLSEIRQAELPKTLDGHGINLNQQLFQILLLGVQKQFDTMGFNTEPENIRILKITSVTPHTPKYSENEGVMRMLGFELQVAGRKPIEPDADAEVSLEIQNNPPVNKTEFPDEVQWSDFLTLQQPVRVDCSIFPDVERMLNLSINRTPNEIVRVIETDHSFQVAFTRYGHGVGLSQRGAEWMAKQYGKDHRQILQFYYPGTELKMYDTSALLPPAMNTDFLATPGPIPTPTPRPTLMPQSDIPADNQQIVIVTGVAPNSSLNLRAIPSLSSEVLMRLFYGQELLVIEKLQDGWLHVKTDVVQGYVKEEFVSRKPR